MLHTRFKRALSIALSAVLALQLALPSAAYAQQREVELENHAAVATRNARTTPISGIRIDGVDAPKPGAGLDDRAAVQAAEGPTWDIPVLWVRDDLQIDRDEADEGHSYLPVLAFFVPQGYALDSDTFVVTLSDSLTELFGSQETISVYDASTGITYILPASLKDLFVRARANAQPSAGAEQTDVVAPGSVAADVAQVDSVQAGEQETPNDMEGESVVEVFCAQTARDALTDEDLEWLIDLIMHRLQPQAVELLLSSFPTFGEAAKRGEIGEEIGLYVYYLTGDDDGDPNHQALSSALAYVAGDGQMVDGEAKYCYLLAVDVDSLLKKDDKGNPIRNEATGKYTLLREGGPMITFENTIVHETLHAIMDDFNRTGMVGGTSLDDIITGPDGRFETDELLDRFRALRYPLWFIEGTASAVENVYQYRYDLFQVLRRGQGAAGYGTGDLNGRFTAQDVLNNYLFAKYKDGSDIYFNIEASDLSKDMEGNDVDTSASRYVTGYLATLYLCELTARNAYGKSTIQTSGGTTTINTTMLRGGLNAIVSAMHDGSSLDEVIRLVSPTDENGKAVYTSTDDFTAKFIKGPLDDDTYYTDKESMEFVLTFLNYLLDLDEALGEGRHPDGSILVPFEQYYNTPLDSDREARSEYLHIVNSNTAVASTVKSGEARIGGGKTDPDKGVASATQRQAEEEELPAAAKAKDKDNDKDKTKAGDGGTKDKGAGEAGGNEAGVKGATKGKEKAGAKGDEGAGAKGVTTDEGAGDKGEGTSKGGDATKDGAAAQDKAETKGAVSAEGVVEPDVAAKPDKTVEAGVAEEALVADGPAASEPVAMTEEAGSVVAEAPAAVEVAAAPEAGVEPVTAAEPEAGPSFAPEAEAPTPMAEESATE